jgi:hypothetical protein
MSVYSGEAEHISRRARLRRAQIGFDDHAHPGIKRSWREGTPALFTETTASRSRSACVHRPRRQLRFKNRENVTAPVRGRALVAGDKAAFHACAFLGCYQETLPGPPLPPPLLCRGRCRLHLRLRPVHLRGRHRPIHRAAGLGYGARTPAVDQPRPARLQGLQPGRGEMVVPGAGNNVLYVQVAIPLLGLLTLQRVCLIEGATLSISFTLAFTITMCWCDQDSSPVLGVSGGRQLELEIRKLLPLRFAN